MREKYTLRWTLLLLFLFILFALDLSLGSVTIPFRDIVKILSGNPASRAVWTDILWEFRMPKALTCVLAGGALAVAGLQMQTLFRNALAGPDVLGLTSGASLAVALVFMGYSGAFTFLSEPHPLLLSAVASAGCAAVLLIMLLVARKLEDNVSLLIVGLMVGAATASVVSILQYVSKAEEMQTYILWTFGNLGGLGWQELKILSVALLCGVAIAFSQLKPLNAWLLGDNYARSLGIHVRNARVAIMISASILTGGVTAFCGPIAFVGLAVPHLTRLVINSNNHKILLPAVLVGGAILLLLCDIVSLLPGGTYVLPVNALTAMVGAPVVVWIIIRNKKLRL